MPKTPRAAEIGATTIGPATAAPGPWLTVPATRTVASGPPTIPAWTAPPGAPGNPGEMSTALGADVSSDRCRALGERIDTRRPPGRLCKRGGVDEDEGGAGTAGPRRIR